MFSAQQRSCFYLGGLSNKGLIIQIFCNSPYAATPKFRIKDKNLNSGPLNSLQRALKISKTTAGQNAPSTLSLSHPFWCHHEKCCSNSGGKQPLKKSQGSPFMLAGSHCLFSGLTGRDDGKETSRKYTNTTSRPPSSPPACRENTRRNLRPAEPKPEPDLFTKPLLRQAPEPMARDGVRVGGGGDLVEKMDWEGLRLIQMGENIDVMAITDHVIIVLILLPWSKCSPNPFIPPSAIHQSNHLISIHLLIHPLGGVRGSF